MAETEGFEALAALAVRFPDTDKIPTGFWIPTKESHRQKRETRRTEPPVPPQKKSERMAAAPKRQAAKFTRTEMSIRRDEFIAKFPSDRDAPLIRGDKADCTCRTDIRRSQDHRSHVGVLSRLGSRRLAPYPANGPAIAECA